jgi:spore coat protein U-like protein
MRRTRTPLALGAALAVGAPAAVATTCSVAVSALAFGIYDTVQTGPTDTTGTVVVTCTPGATDPLTTPYTITLAGTGTGNDSVRSITAGGYRLYYQAYQDAGRSVVWGNGAASGAGVAGSTTSTAALVPGLQTHTAYGRMPAAQAVPPGLYTGSLLVTIDY